MSDVVKIDEVMPVNRGFLNGLARLLQGDRHCDWPDHPEEAVEDGWLRTEGKWRPWSLPLDVEVVPWDKRLGNPSPAPAWQCAAPFADRQGADSAGASLSLTSSS